MRLLIPLAVICFAVNAILTRLFQVKFPAQKVYIRLYQSLFSLFAGIAFFCGSGLNFKMSVPLFVNGILFGTLFFAATLGFTVGCEIGSMSLTSIIANMSLIIPIIYSCITLGEDVTLLQVVGITLIFITLFLSSFSLEKSKKRASVFWAAAVLLSFVSNGITSVIQKHYVLAEGEGTLLQFMSLAYLTSAMIYAAYFLVSFPKVPAEDKNKYNKKVVFLLILFSLASGIGSFGGNALLGILSVKINGAVLYPCINGGLCLLASLASYLFFKEKPSTYKICAMATGIAAIVMLNI